MKGSNGSSRTPCWQRMPRPRQQQQRSGDFGVFNSFGPVQELELNTLAPGPDYGQMEDGIDTKVDEKMMKGMPLWYFEPRFLWIPVRKRLIAQNWDNNMEYV